MRAAIYARISETEDTYGVERQEEDCRRLADRHGYEVVAVYVDNDLSASDKSTKPRPEFDRLVNAVKSGEVDRVIAYTQARLSRRPIELLTFLHACRDASVGVSYVDDVDIEPGESLFVATIIAGKDAEYSRKLSVDGKRAKLAHAEAGRPSGVPRPFGYEGADRVTGRLSGEVVRESEAELIKDGAARILQGASVSSIARAWTDANIPTVRGGRRWTPSIVRNILLNPRNAGLRVYQGEIIGDAVWDAIIDRATWEQVCAILKDPTRRPKASRHSYPLKGLLVCAECGRKLTSAPRLKRGKSIPTYECKKVQGGCGLAVSGRAVEDYVFGIVRPLADSPTMRDVITTHTAAEGDQVSQLLQANAADNSKLEELAGLVADGTFKLDHVRKASAELRSNIEARTVRIGTLRSQSVFDRFGGSVAEAWDTMSDDDKRAMVAAFIPKVRVRRSVRSSSKFDTKRLVFTWRIPALAKAAAGMPLEGYGDETPVFEDEVVAEAS